MLYYKMLNPNLPKACKKRSPPADTIQYITDNSINLQDSNNNKRITFPLLGKQ